MGDSRALKALLWKELRASRALALVLAVLPPALIKAASMFPDGEWQRGLLRYSCALILAILLVVWGSTKPIAEKNAAEFADTCLPVKAYIRWLASFVLPFVIVAALGAWYGLWVTMLDNWRGVAINAEAGMLMIVVTFCVPYVLSATISRWPALLVGTVLAIPVACSLQNPNEVAQFHWFLWAELLASLVVGVFAFDILLRNKPLRLRQVIALLIPVAAFAVVAYTSQPPGGAYYYTYYFPPHLDSSDWSKSVGIVRPRPGPSFNLEFHNYRTKALVQRRFNGAVAPIDFLGEDRVFLVQQLPSESNTSVLEWNTKLDRVRRVASLPTGTFALLQWSGAPRGFVRPDGRYLVLSLQSMAGQGQDLWVVDLRSGVGMVAAPNASLARDSIRWIGDEAILYGDGTPTRLDLRAMAANYIRHPVKGVQQ